MKKIQRVIVGLLSICLLLQVSGCGNSLIGKSAYTKDAESIVETIKQEKSDGLGEEASEEVKEVAQTTEEDVTTPSEGDQQADGSTSSQPPATTPEKPSNTPNASKKKQVTMSIETHTILNNMDKLDPKKETYPPKDGWVLKPITVSFEEGDTVFDVLEKVTRERRIHMEYQGANQGMYNSVYVQGIAQLYEFDCGNLSGWMYSINGAYVPQGASATTLEDGMVIKWMYTCDLGRDLGFS